MAGELLDCGHCYFVITVIAFSRSTPIDLVGDLVIKKNNTDGPEFIFGAMASHLVNVFTYFKQEVFSVCNAGLVGNFGCGGRS